MNIQQELDQLHSELQTSYLLATSEPETCADMGYENDDRQLIIRLINNLGDLAQILDKLIETIKQQ